MKLVSSNQAQIDIKQLEEIEKVVLALFMKLKKKKHANYLQIKLLIVMMTKKYATKR